MSGLDLSILSDDQLIELIRAALDEVTRRDAATGAAAHQVILDAAELSRIAATASEQEAARLRAEARERAAREAADAVRRERGAELERERIRAKHAQEMATIRRVAEACGTDPRRTYVSVWRRGYGQECKRVYIQDGGFYDQGRTLVTYYASAGDKLPQGSISTTRDLVTRKPALVPICAELAGAWSSLQLDPTLYDWEEVARDGAHAPA